MVESIPELTFLPSFPCMYCGKLPASDHACCRCNRCGRSFCVFCFVPNYDDRYGRSLRCPYEHCRAVLRFPRSYPRAAGARPEIALLTDTPRPGRTRPEDWRSVRAFLGTIRGTKYT